MPSNASSAAFCCPSRASTSTSRARTYGEFGSTGTMRSEERRVGKECRSRCDWSSDVCSSDLDAEQRVLCRFLLPLARQHFYEPRPNVRRVWIDRYDEIGRASCRERV